MLPMLRPMGIRTTKCHIHWNGTIEWRILSYSATSIFHTNPMQMMLRRLMDVPTSEWLFRPNQRIIMLNNGVSGKGFTICCDCGCCNCPEMTPRSLKDVLRPYRSKFIKTRCKHKRYNQCESWIWLCYRYAFLEFALDRQQIDINPTRNSWLNRAGQSLAEGLRLASMSELDIEFTELVTGFVFDKIAMEISLISICMIAFQVVQVMLLALNPLFDSYLPKLENFSKAVPVTVLATGV